MADHLSRERRSENMARIRSKDTKPEMRIRRLLHKEGYRYRCHVPGLAGKPDLVFTRRRKALFVHGCFWHQHSGCPRATRPKTNQPYWLEKLARNVERDARHVRILENGGWSVLVVWECQSSAPELVRRLRNFLGPTLVPRTGDMP